MKALSIDIARLAIQAGELAIAQRDKHPIRTKHDGSPITQADLLIHDILSTHISSLSLYMISSEEHPLSYEQKIHAPYYWLIDPLDGTKDFLAGYTGWTINIALLQGTPLASSTSSHAINASSIASHKPSSALYTHEPVLGVVYAPCLRMLFIGAEGLGARRYIIPKDISTLRADFFNMYECFDALCLNAKSTRRAITHKTHAHASSKLTSHRQLIACDSVFHSSAHTQAFLTRYHLISHKLGSALKFCALASKEADIYPRFNGSKEWDSAASHIILRQSGGEILSLKTRKPLTYTKPSVENDFFIAFSEEQIGGEIWQDVLAGKVNYP